jgi:hypothetical protein
MHRGHRGSLFALAVLAFARSAFGAPAPLPEVSENDIKYATPQAALAAVSSRPGVEVTIENGWTIVADLNAHEIWSFAPQGHPAYPTAVKRALTETSQGVLMSMSVDCHATKTACDNVVRQFEELNDRASRAAQTPGRKSPTPPKT